MKTRPLLFTGPMVRAILDGRKTQTRRIVKPQPPNGHNWVGWTMTSTHREDEGKATWGRGDTSALIHDAHRVRCPYGQPGDRLWVRETWHAHSLLDSLSPSSLPKIDGLHYAADPWPKFWPPGKMRPSIHMPRWASRITLEITGVRVERLQEISEADAKAEGIEPLFTDAEMAARPELARHRGKWCNYLWHGYHGKYGMGNAKSRAWPHQFSGYDDPRGSYSSLWESINGPGSWAANPWVWVVEFKRVTTDKETPK